MERRGEIGLVLATEGIDERALDQRGAEVREQRRDALAQCPDRLSVVDPFPQFVNRFALADLDRAVRCMLQDLEHQR